jgi:polyhydroxybutyrate depolymerase
MKLYLGLLFTFFFVTVSTHPVAAQETTMTWTIDGISRQAIVVPPSSGEKGAKAPLLFFFHGHGGHMDRTVEKIDFQALWPEAVVVYPQGLPTETKRDPRGVRPGWQKEAGQDGDRDLKFFDAMLGTLRKKYSIDDSKIYVTGFSNGAAFSYLLWSERGKDLAGLGICAGQFWPSDHPTKALPVFVSAGQNDQVLPFSIQQESIQNVLKIDDVSSTSRSCGTNCTLYPSTKHTPVATIIHPGGHACPPFATSGMVGFFKKQAASQTK